MARTLLVLGLAILVLGILFRLTIWMLKYSLPLGLILILVGLIWLLAERVKKTTP